MRINKIISGFVLAGMGLVALTACDKDTIDYTPGTYPNAQDVYFKIQATNNYEVGETDNQFVFNVYRVSDKAPSSVKLEWAGDTELFTLPETAEFADDELMTGVTIELVPQDLTPMQPYNLSVSIQGGADTPYTQSKINFEFTYFPMSEWALFGYDEALGRDGLGAYTFTGYYSGTEDPVLVEYCYSLVDENQMQFRFSWLIDNDDPDLGYEVFLTAASSDGGKTITVPSQYFAENASYGAVYACDYGTYVGDSTQNEGYFDDETGTFYLDMIYYVSAGYWSGLETCVMNGYLDTNDYTVNVTDLGVATIEDVNYQLVNISWTDAVSIVQYSIVDTASLIEEGAMSQDLLDALAEKMQNDEVETTTVKTQGVVALSFPSKGEYTLVAVGYKEENDGSATIKSVTPLSFTYTTTDPNEGWDILGYVEYTEGYLCGVYGAPVVTYYVEVQENQDEPGYYRLVNAYGADYPFNEPGDWDDSVTSYLYIDATNPDQVYIPYSEQTLDWGNGKLVCYSLAAYYMNNGYSAEDVAQAGYFGTMADDKITFPYKGLVAYLGDQGPFSTNLAYDENDEPMVNVDGSPYAPFLVDLSTLTDDPVDGGQQGKPAKMAKKNVKVNSGIMAEKIAGNKTARVVKYKAVSLSKGTRTPYLNAPRSSSASRR